VVNLESETLWRAEAQRRYQELLHGKYQGQAATRHFPKLNSVVKNKAVKHGDFLTF
jgi:hypothetical protein